MNDRKQQKSNFQMKAMLQIFIELLKKSLKINIKTFSNLLNTLHNEKNNKQKIFQRNSYHTK